MGKIIRNCGQEHFAAAAWCWVIFPCQHCQASAILVVYPVSVDVHSLKFTVYLVNLLSLVWEFSYLCYVINCRVWIICTVYGCLSDYLFVCYRTHMYVNACMYVCLYVCLFVCVYVCVYVCVCVCVHVCMDGWM